MSRDLSVRRFSVTEAALLLVLAYMASKGLGAVRQALFNSLFGTGAAATAYYAAFRLPDTIFNLIAGGALAHAFIPVFLSREKERGEQEVWRLSSLMFNLLLVSLAAVVLSAEFLAPAFVNTLLVPGLPASERDLTTTLTRIMLIQPVILGLGTIATAILHSKRQFFPSAIAIAVYELGPIGGLLATRFVPAIGIYGPAYGLLASALLQVAVQIPNVIKLGIHYSFIWNLNYPGLRAILRLLGPNVMNVVVVSAGAIVVTSFASYLPDKSSIAAMHNAFLLFAIPLTLVSQTIGNALLPQLSSQAACKRYVRMSWTAVKIVSGAFLLSIMAAVLLYFLGKPAIHMLFQHGAFSEHASMLTNLALLGYAIGLPGQTVSLLVVLCFYACKNALTPLFLNVGALVVQIGLSLLLIKMLKGSSAILALPTASSLSATLQAIVLCLLLWVYLRTKVRTDKGLLRLQQRRKGGLILQQPTSPRLPVPLYRSALETGLQVAPANQSLAMAQAWVADNIPAVANQGGVQKLSLPVLQPVVHYQPIMQFQQMAVPRQAEAQYVLPVSARVKAPNEPETQPLLLMEPKMKSMNPQVTGRQSALEPQTRSVDTPVTSLPLVVMNRPLTLDDYQRMVLLAPGNLMARVRWHIAMITGTSTDVAASLGVLANICRQLRERKQRNTEMVPMMYRQAAAEYPENANVRFALGQMYQLTGKYAEAIDAYLLAMHEGSLKVMAYYSVAQCLLMQGKFEDAIQQLEQALQIIHSNPANAVDSAAWVARPAAEGEMHQAPEKEIVALLAVAREHIKRQEVVDEPQEKHMAELQSEVFVPVEERTTLPGIVDDTIQTNIEKVQYYRAHHQPEQAIGVLREMLEQEPHNPWPHHELVDIYMQDGLLSRAIEELAALTVIYLRNNQRQQAGAMVQCIGNIHAEVGDTEEALLYLRRALELVSGDVKLLEELVDCCMQLGRTEDATEYQMMIIQYYFDTHELLEQVNALQRLIMIDRHNYAAYDLLGQTYQSVGEYEQVAEIYQQLAKVQSENATAPKRLAKLQELDARAVA